MARKTRVFIVDDSKYMRFLMRKIFSGSSDIEVIGEARDGVDALLQIPGLKPDVVTLDIEMPRMDGLMTLRKLQSGSKVPVVMVSRHSGRNGEEAIRALELGAVDFIRKPEGQDALTFESIADEIIQKVRQAASASVDKAGISERPAEEVLQEPEAKTEEAGKEVPAPTELRRVLVIGSSMGGPKVLTEIYRAMPAGLPLGVLSVQHIPAGFSTLLAKRLNGLCAIRVSEAARGDTIAPARALLAPGGFHTRISPGGIIRLDKTPPVHNVRPSVDVTLKDAAEVFSDKVVCVILTGMGYDGREGAAAVRDAGGKVFVQEISTCIVDGMPSAVIDAGIAHKTLPPEDIVPEVVSLL